MRLRHHRFDELKMNVVREALEGGNASYVARKHGFSPKAVSGWVRKYRDEVESNMAKKNVSDRLLNPITAEDWKAKYEQAAKLLGEKDLELAILRDLVKKNPSTKDLK